MARLELSPAAPRGHMAPNRSLLLESAGQGRLDSIIKLMDQQPGILDSRGQFGKLFRRPGCTAWPKKLQKV